MSRECKVCFLLARIVAIRMILPNNRVMPTPKLSGMLFLNTIRAFVCEVSPPFDLAQLHFRQVELTSIDGRVNDSPTMGGRRIERMVQTRNVVRIQVVANERHLFAVRVLAIQSSRHFQGPVRFTTLLASCRFSPTG